MIRSLRWLTTLLALVLPFAATAQQQGLEIDIVGGNAAALPIAVVPFAGSAGQTDISSVIAADLGRSGQFRTLPERDMVERPTTGAEVNYATWRLLKQDFLLIGRVLDAGGQLRVEYELFDVAKQARLLGEAKIAPGSAARDVAHQIADAVYEKILGVRGAFWTRIAYVTATGTGRNRHYALMVADSDGCSRRRGARTASASPTSVSIAAVRRSTSRTSPPVDASSSPASAASTAHRTSRRTAASWR
jgi:TolB protein